MLREKLKRRRGVGCVMGACGYVCVRECTGYCIEEEIEVLFRR